MRGLTLPRMILPAAALALAVLAVLAVLDRLGDNARSAARQALLARAVTLEQSALTPGSMLPCVDGTSGETVGNACEKRVFASAQSTAAAVAYMGARVTLLREAATLAKRGDKAVLKALATTRRAVALDRYGIAAHVLAERDGCTADKCAVFAALTNADALKANLKAQTFDQYVSRYAGAWGKAAPAPASGPAVSALPPAASDAQRAANATPLPASKPGGEARAEATPPGAPMLGKPVPSRWHFPSASSIPAVSIMDPEPKLPKAIAEQLHRDTARKAAIERRKEGKDAKETKPPKTAARHSKPGTETEQKPQQPGAPLDLTR